MGEFWASPLQATWLGWIPVPAMILGADGSAVAVNPTWASMLRVAAEGDGWVEAVEPPFRSLVRARLRLAVAAGEPGSVDCRVSGPDGSRWSRWWWHPAPPQNLVVCVGVIEDSQLRAALASPRDAADPRR
jgi:PAS domain-containing protein